MYFIILKFGNWMRVIELYDYFLIWLGFLLKLIGLIEVSDINKTFVKLFWKFSIYDGGFFFIGYLVEKREGRRLWIKVDKISFELIKF